MGRWAVGEAWPHPNRNRLDSEAILNNLYTSNISASISWIWDTGFQFALGDPLQAEGWGFPSISAAAICLRDEACAYYPDSDFARKYGWFVYAAGRKERSLRPPPLPRLSRDSNPRTTREHISASRTITRAAGNWIMQARTTTLAACNEAVNDVRARPLAYGSMFAVYLPYTDGLLVAEFTKQLI
jgi:hypothetical protein